MSFRRTRGKTLFSILLDKKADEIQKMNSSSHPSKRQPYLEKKQAVEALDAYTNSLMLKACESDYLTNPKIFIDEYGVHLNAENGKKSTAMELAKKQRSQERIHVNHQLLMY